MKKIVWNAVVQQDCLEGMRQLSEGEVDLVFADPPFNIGYQYDQYNDTRTAEDYLQWSESWMREVIRILKPDGTFWLAIGDDFAAELKVLATRTLGLTCRSWVVWYYTFGVHCSKKFTRSHTHLFHFVKKPTKFTFNDEAIRVPSARQLVYGDRRANPKGRVPDDTWILRPQDALGSFTEGEDVWFFPRVCGTFKERTGWHSCQMPEQLLGRIIKASSNSGEKVLDPFLGSGSTVCVAKKLDRKFLGFEISEEYLKSVKERLQNIAVGDPLDGFENPLGSSPSTAEGRDVSQVQPRKRFVRKTPPKE